MHIFIELVVAAVLSRRVGEHQLQIALGVHPHDAGAGGLRLVRHNGDLAADDGVEQRGFPHIRLADNGDKTRGRLFRHGISSAL